MKKYLLLLSFLFLAGWIQAQTYSIPNGSFEQWDSAVAETPQFYPYNSNMENFYKNHLPFNLTKTTTAYHGTYAARIASVASATDTAFGYFINIDPKNGNPFTWKGGMPYSQKPTGIRGYYQYNLSGTDSATIFVIFNKGGTTIGGNVFKIGGIHSTYTLFNFNFSPLPLAPDSVILGFASSDVMGNKNGSAGGVLLIDSVSFTGVSTQPSEMNGDFESWQSLTMYRPQGWFTEGSNDGNGIKRSTDAQSGTFSAELITTASTDNNGNPRAQPANVATGYYPRDCNNNCYLQGGYPYSRMIDTLSFYYKYAPVNNDTANVMLTFKKNYVQFAGAQKNLTAASTYTYVEIPVNLSQAPDSVIVQISSSSWRDSAVTFAGSDLKIDRMHFKSQPYAPVAGTITHPTCTSGGSVVLSGIESSGNWKILQSPGNIITTGTGTSITITGLSQGTYTFRLITSIGDTSASTASVTINSPPSPPTAPTIGNITQPTCTSATGSAVLNGLPAGNWTITRTPGGNTTTGTGSSTTISGIPAGTYTFTVTNDQGCTSSASSSAVINAQPATPSAPTIGTITQPTCTVSTGSVDLTGLPSGNWTLTRSPGGNTSTGSTSATTISGLAPGTYTFTVTNSAGCTSSASANIVINASSSAPSAPTIGTITQPTCTVATGSVVLNGLPSTGTWTLTRTPGGTTTTGTGTTTTISGLATGTYTYTVTNASSCISQPSANVVIDPQPAKPATPVVTRTANVLHSSASTGNQWYNLSGAISGATSQDYNVISNNDYYVIVTVNGCQSDTSNKIHVINIGISPIAGVKPVSVYPNPVSGEINISYEDNITPTQVDVFSISGELLYSGVMKDKITINAAGFSAGVYMIRLENDKMITFRRVVKD
jgi:hypothetical protein